MAKKNDDRKHQEKKREGFSSSLIEKFANELQAVQSNKR